MGAGDGKHATIRVARVIDEAGSGAVVASINDIAIFIIDEKVQSKEVRWGAAGVGDFLALFGLLQGYDLPQVEVYELTRADIVRGAEAFSSTSVQLNVGCRSTDSSE